MLGLENGPNSQSESVPVSSLSIGVTIYGGIMMIERLTE